MQDTMPYNDDTQNDIGKFQRLAEINEHKSWADYGSCAPLHELLAPYIVGYTYSVGCVREQEAKFITRAYPTVMTQLYFEFCGELSEVKDSHGMFAFGKGEGQANTVINKRTYVKQGLGGWFDIYQLPSLRKSRPIKNIKIDLYPYTLFQLFRLSPQEIVDEDLQLADLLGTTTASLMLEEMEAADTGKELVEIVERYFLDQLLYVNAKSPYDGQFEPRLPALNETLSIQAQRYNKSERWLQKHYTKTYGMPFKQMQGNLRFMHAHQVMSHALGMRQPVNLTDLACNAGYFDQAHFIRNFKKYTGMTPGQYLRSQSGQANEQLFYW